MALWNVFGQVVDDSQDDVSIPDTAIRLPEYHLPWQYSSDTGARFQWDPVFAGAGAAPAGMDIAPGYIPQLLQWAHQADVGTLSDIDRWQYEQMREQAMAVPLRDVSTLYSGYTAAQDDPDSLRLLSAMSPDVGRFLLETQGKLVQGTATPHEQALFTDLRRQAEDWNWRASVPQASDAFNPLGNELFGALAILGTGATAGLAAAPLFAGGAGLATTLGSLGTLAGTAGGWASTIGGATGQDWLQKVGMGLGLAGGLAGAAGGIGSALGTGLRTVGDVGRLASGTSKLLSTVGSAANQPGLKQAANYLGLAGSLGRMGGGTTPLLSAAQQASQAGGGPMEFDYSWDYGGGTPYDNWSWDAGATDPSAWQTFTGWGDPYGPGSSGDTGFSGEGSGGWLNTALGALGGVGGFLGKNAGWLGPAVSSLGSLGTGLIGAQGSRDASAAQSAALNRALSLQEAQWLQQQQNMAPWLAHGREALANLGGIANMGQPAGFQGPGTLQAGQYGFQGPGMTWSPQSYAGYTPTAIPGAEGYRYTPGQYLNQTGAMPATGFQYANQFPLEGFDAPSFEALKARDPGIQARLDESRKALEASALARGTGMSGSTLAALQRQAQDLTSQEYQPAYGRALGEYQMRYGQDWQRQQEAYQRALAQNELLYGRGWQQYVQGWGQGLTREELARQAQAQNWGQALQEAQARAQQQQFGWQAGFQGQQQQQREAQQYGQELYQRALGENQLRYARDLAQNQTDYDRALTSWNAQNMAQKTLWDRWASLAGLGQLSTSQLGNQGAANTQQMNALLGQLGSAQALAPLGSAYNWNQALGGVTNNLTGVLAGLNR